ncbi:MAG TPA: Bax inhibitor-1/YccA family protein [Bacilli bacterium]|nr:MAG: Bax inhibitor 1 like protein [Tenericutes bacterium ADurb.BinA124]HNZ50265.1 Bax inhibitor-1/YccA family protein [Bacilli bacterium]HOH18360.1 Bax inhibitor-1/YccA family protein [Bacilli bacterium]HPX84644.1 Bax inhibitor-1/YccA family protein [Bacilli bacterium]
MRFRSHNPVFQRVLKTAYEGENYEVASYRGVAFKTIYFIALTILGAIISLWAAMAHPNALGSLLPIALVVTIISSMLALWVPSLSQVFGSVYCLGEGLLVGFVSLLFELEAPGVVLTAILATIVVLIVVTTLFVTRAIVVNSRFIRFLLIFSISMFLTQLLLWIISFSFGITYSFGFSMLTSGIMVFIATLFLLFDLESITQVVEGRAPKQWEWYVSFGLVFTIIWLYMEILPIIAQLFFDRN